MKLIGGVVLALVIALAFQTYRLMSVRAQLEVATLTLAVATEANASNMVAIGQVRKALNDCTAIVARMQIQFTEAEQAHQQREAARLAALRTTQQELARVREANRDWADARHPDLGGLFASAAGPD